MAIARETRSELGTKPEPILPQGRIEKVFPSDEACTERAQLAKGEGWQEPADGGFAMKRGILTGALAERQLLYYATDRGFEVDLGRSIDEILASRRLGVFPADRTAELRSAAIGMVRGFQSRFPADDGELDWSEVTSLLKPQTDLFVRRPGKFAIRVRPDAVVGVRDVLVAVEFTTAKDPLSLSPARLALNHWALLRERRRHPEWDQFRRVATRIERLALGDANTVQLSDDDADRWRIRLGKAAEDLMLGNYQKNPGPWCSTCPWQAPCWFGDEHDETHAF